MDSNQDFGSILNTFSGSSPKAPKQDSGDGLGSLLNSYEQVRTSPTRTVSNDPVGGGSVDEFVKAVSPAAQRVAQRLNVPVEAIIGQWGVETGWGKKVIPGTNNLGNIKDPSGAGVAATDNATGSRDAYRQYGSVDEFADDFANLVGNGRYKAVSGSRDAQTYFNGLKAGGYAEDPNYVQTGTKASAMAAEALKRAGVAPKQQDNGPDLSKAPKWADVEGKAEFKALSPEKQAEAKSAYFDYWIAPRAGERGGELRQKFLTPATKPNADASIVSDVGNLAGMGVNAMAQDVRELVGRIPGVGKTIVDKLDAIDKWASGKSSDELLNSNVEDAQKRLTPEMQAAGEKKWWDSDTKTLGDAWTDPRSYVSGLVQSLPEQALTMIPSMALAKGIYAAKLAAGVAPEVAAAAASRAAAVAGGVSEGALGGAQSSRQVRDKIMGMTPEQLQNSDALKALVSQGVPFEQAREQLANDSATQAFIVAGITTGAFGGMGDRMLAKAITEGVGKNVAGRVAKGIVGEGVLEEFPQSYTQAVSENLAMRRADPSIGITDDALNQGLGGLAVGALQGGGMAAGFGHNKPQPVPPAQGAAPSMAPDSAPTEASVTPDGRIEPTLNQEAAATVTPAESAGAPAVHPTVQAADDIVRELATDAGIPHETVLPTQADPIPDGNSVAGQEATSDQDVIDFASNRYQQLREKRDGQTQSVMGETGMVDQDMPGVGLSPAEQQELNGLQRAGNDPKALRAIYGLGDSIPSDQSQLQNQAQVPALSTTPVEQPTEGQQFPATNEPGLVAAQEDQNVETQQQNQATGPALDQGASVPNGQPSGPAAIQEPATQAPAAQNDGVNAVGNTGQQDGTVQANDAVIPLSERSDDDLRQQLRDAGSRDITRAISAELQRRKDAAAKPTTEKQARQQKEAANGTQAPQAQQAEAQGQETPTAEPVSNTAPVVRDANAREIAAAKDASPMLDLQKKATGWKQVPLANGNGTILVSADGKKAVTFESANKASGTEGMRANALAQAYAIDNPYTVEATQPQGELVVEPMFKKKPATEKEAKANKVETVAEKQQSDVSKTEPQNDTSEKRVDVSDKPQRYEYPTPLKGQPAYLEPAQRAVVDFMNGDIDKPALLQRFTDLDLTEGQIRSVTNRIDITKDEIDQVAAMRAANKPKTEKEVKAARTKKSAPKVEKTATPAAKSSTNTEDAGAELTYNKRNRITTGIQWTDIADKDAALRVKETTKQNVYPRPDYAALVEGGMQPLVAHLVKQAYDALASAPQVSKAPTDDQLKAYIQGVQRYMNGVMAWANDNELVKQWVAKTAVRAGAYLGASKGVPTSLSEMAQQSTKSLLDVVYPNGWKEHRDELILIGGNKALGALQPSTTEALKANKDIAKGWPAKQEAWQKQGYKIVVGSKIEPDFYESTRNGTPRVYAMLKFNDGRRNITIVERTFEGIASKDDAQVQEWVKMEQEAYKPRFVVLDKNNRVKAWGMSQEAAEQQARDLTKRTGGGGIKDEGISVEMASRTGVEHRMPGEDISSERLVETFGFKGVNFGNWMKGESNKAERQLHLNHVFDAFMDLAAIFGVPPKAMSLNGLLGIAVGAQGNGKYAAHFVPGVNEINLTRTSGAGSLAHEWGHALDHYFARQADLTRETDPFLTEHAPLGATMKRMEMVNGKYQSVEKSRFGEGIRPEIVEAFKSIVQTMSKRPITEEEVALRREESLARTVKNTDSWLKAVRRDFESAKASDEVLAKVDALAERVRKLDLGDGKVSVSTTFAISQPVAEMRDLYKKTTGRTYSLDQTKGLQSNVDHLKYLTDDKQDAKTHTPQQVSTTYAKEAAALDGDKGGKRYWSTNLEMFARAFDAYVSDKLEAQAASNTYLSHAGRTGETVPRGAERTAINEAIQKLVDTVEHKETDQGVALFNAKSGENATQVPDGEGYTVKQNPTETDLKNVRALNRSLVQYLRKNGQAVDDGTVGYVPAEIRGNEAVGEVARAFGQRIQWVLQNPVLDGRQRDQFGFFNGANYLGFNFIRVDGVDRPHLAILGHEIVHQLRKDNPELYDEFQEAVARYIKPSAHKHFIENNPSAKLAETSDKKHEEFMAEIGSDAFMEPKFWESIGNQNPSLLRTLVDIAKRLVEKVKAKLGYKKNTEYVFNDYNRVIQIAAGVLGQYMESQQAKSQADDISFNATQTSNFKKWFGDSKVVDEQGKPLVVYHGTPYGGFSEFDPARSGTRDTFDSARAGIYFSSTPIYAGAMARSADETGPSIYPVYLSIQNPLQVFTTELTGDAEVDRMIADAKAGGHDGIIDEMGNFVVFTPTQIKSATGNNGQYDQNNPDISFNAKDEPTVSATTRKVQNNLIQFFGNRDGNSLKTFGLYDKTLSTQYNKALKDKHFGKVFGYVNAMQNEVSLTSIRPAELAPGVLPRVDDVKSAAKQLVKGKKSDNHLNIASKAIFDGTLDGDTVMQGKVWSESEFMARPGATEAAWGLYQQARTAIDASLTEVAAAEAYAMAQGFVPKTLRRQIIDTPRAAERLIADQITKQIKMLDTAIEKAKSIGADEQQADLERARSSYLSTQTNIDKIFATAKSLKQAGYAPLMRFGKFTVTVQPINPENGHVLRDEIGEPITEFFGQYETEGEAKSVRAQMEAKYAGRDDMRVKAGAKSQSSHELYSGISPETLALFAEAIGADAAMRKHIELAMTERSALKRRLHRKGTVGFSEDLPRVLSQFITSNGRHAAQRYYLRDLNNAIKYIPKEKGDVLDEAIRLKKFVLNPNDPAAPLSSVMFAWFLGGSVASAIVNLTQPVMMTAPYLSQFGVSTATKAMAKAMPYALGKKQITDTALRDALKRASQEGIVDAQEIFHLYSVGAQGVASGLVNQLAKLPGVGNKIKAGSEDARARINAFMTLWGSMFAVAEGFNRKLTFVAAWEVAKANGEKNPFAFAVRAVNETQGIYNKVNRPNWAQGPVGRTLLTFKQYSIMYVELLTRMWKRGGPEGKRAALTMLAVLMLAAGEDGLPFSQDLDDIIDTVGQMFGLDTNTKRNKRRVAHEILGKSLGDMFLYGVSPYLPLDFAGRIGLGNLIPGTALLKPSDADMRGRQAAELLGPTAGMATQIGDAYDAVVEGNSGKAVQNLAPKAVKDALAAGEMAKKGYATDAKGRKVVDVGLSDAAIKGIGFQPTKVAEETRKTMPVFQDIALQKKTEASIVGQWSRGITDNDQDMIRDAVQRRDDWNKRNPDTPIHITPEQVRSRVRQAMIEKDARLLKQAPREMRGRVGLDLSK